MSSSMHGRYAVFVVDLPPGVKPPSPFTIPTYFVNPARYVAKVPLYVAAGFALAFNKHQLAERMPDRKWALAVCGRIGNGRPLDEWARQDFINQNEPAGGGHVDP